MRRHDLGAVCNQGEVIREEFRCFGLRYLLLVIECSIVGLDLPLDNSRPLVKSGITPVSGLFVYTGNRPTRAAQLALV